MKKSVSVKFLAAALSILLIRTSAFAVGAAGFTNQVPHARANGMGMSIVASVNDASASYYNPARLTAMKGGEVSLGATYITFTTDYDSKTGTTAQNEDFPGTAPNFYFAHNFEDKNIALGFGVNATHGLSSKWDENGPLRYMATKSEYAVVDYNPVIGLKLSDTFSIGVGLDYYKTASAELNKRVNQATLNAVLETQSPFDVIPGGSSGVEADGYQRLQADGDGLGMTLSAAYSLEERHMVGITYRSGTHLDLDGEATITGMETGGNMNLLFGGSDYTTTAHTTVPIPDEVMFGYAFRPSEKLLMELDAQWTHWSEFQDINLSFGELNAGRLAVLNSGNPIPKDWKDVWSFGFGTEYKMYDKLSLRGGYNFSSSAVPDYTFEASTPETDIHGFTLGLGTGIGEDIVLDFAVQYYILPERDISNNLDTANLSAFGDGSYETTAIYYTANIGYRWGHK